MPNPEIDKAFIEFNRKYITAVRRREKLTMVFLMCTSIAIILWSLHFQILYEMANGI